MIIGIYARPELPELLRWAFFYLFLFAIGCSVGPQFFGSLERLNALREASGSDVGALAYTVPYPIGNILLTVWGPVVVAIVHAMRD